MNKTLNHRQNKTIQNFWKWFQDNEQAIYYAFKLGIKSDEVLKNLQRNLDYISKRILMYCYEQKSNPNKFCLIFSAYGYRKLFPKIIALGDAAPQLTYFSPQTFIKPHTAENKNDFNDIILQSMVQTLIKLEDYNITTKKIILTLYIPKNYSTENKAVIEHLGETLLCYTLGEVNCKRYIKDFNCKLIPENTNGLLSLAELPEFVDYLAKINYPRKLKLFFE